MTMNPVVRWYIYALFLRLARLRYRLSRRQDSAPVSKKLGKPLNLTSDPTAGDVPYREQMRNREYKVFSQNGEDGLLAYIFSEIGVTNKTFVEFGITDGRECNTANLSINLGWNGLLLEGNPKYVRKARAYYESIESVEQGKVLVSECFVTRENINPAIGGNGVSGEIDLLAIDIDGNDYWVWEAIDVVKPRVVVIEYNASLGTNSLAVKYDAKFSRFRKHWSGWYHGASLIALWKLGVRKGYDLVCTDCSGINAFFLKRDVAKGSLNGLDPGEAFYPHKKRLVVASQDEQFEAIKHLEYIEV